MNGLFAPMREAVLALLIATAGFACGYAAHGLRARSVTVREQAKDVIRTANMAARTEAVIVKTQDRTAAAAQEAHHAISLAPEPAVTPSCDYSAVMAAWRAGLDRVRDAASSGAGDYSAGGAESVHGAGPGQRENASGPG